MKEQYKEVIKTYTSLNKAIESEKPFIYKKTNSLSFEVIPLTNLFGIITDIGDNSFNQSYIPEELINHVDLSLEAPPVVHNSDSNTAYYSPFLGDTAENVFNIITLFNNLPSVNITIYTTDNIYEQVNDLTNSNIKFKVYDKPNGVIIEASTIITHGYSARSFIKQKIPVIIIGENGLGGWVTPSNLNYFLIDNFKGRLGGRLGEYIPLEILFDELLEINTEIKIHSILNKNAEKLGSYLKGFSPKQIDSVIRSIEKIHSKFNDEKTCLLWKLASNAVLGKQYNSITIKRKILNDILFSIPNDEVEFLNDLKAEVTIQKLTEKYDKSEDEFLELMDTLWERKAIVYKL